MAVCFFQPKVYVFEIENKLFFIIIFSFVERRTEWSSQVHGIKYGCRDDNTIEAEAAIEKIVEIVSKDLT